MSIFEKYILYQNMISTMQSKTQIRFKSFIVFFLSFIFCPICAQQTQYKFRLVDASDGLSDSQIRSLTMTPDGCIAIKTGFILNIYNGVTFERFSYDKRQRYFWAYNRPPKEYYDNKGRVWLKELGYLLLLNLDNGQYDYAIADELSSMGIKQRLKNMFIDNNKNYWFVTEDNTVYLYYVEKKQLKVIEKGNSDFTKKYGVPVEMAQYKNLCWIIYESGLIRYWDYSSSEFISQENQFLNRINRYTDRICLHPDRNGNLWLMYNHGIFFFNRMERSWKEVCKISGLSNFFTCMDIDMNGDVWVGTSKSGLRIINSKDFQVRDLPVLELTGGGFMENDISSVFADENGGIWVGTLFQGLCYYHPCMRKFMLGHTVTGSALITNESIRCFFEDTDGSLFIGGGKGVFRFEPLTGKIYKVFELEENDVCLTVMKDSSGALWIGTFLHGFYRIKDGREYNYLRSSKNLQSDPNQNVSRAIYEDSEGHFWVSVTGGVGLFDPVVGKIQYMLSDKHPDLKSYMVVHALYPWDKHSFVALGNNGIYCYDVQNDRTWIPEELKRNGAAYTKYFCMLKDRHGLFWFGTEDGIFILDRKKKICLQLTESDGLPNNAVTAILEDNTGVIWASTLNGLCKIECKKNNSDLKYLVTAYGVEDGLQSGKFYENAAIKTHAGLLFFGGAHGFNFFNPSDMPYDVSEIKPVFTGLSLFDYPVEINKEYGGRIILGNRLSHTSKIVLKHNENFITIAFSALNYVNPTRSYYRYKLDNYDKDWNEVITNGIGQATYTGLRPGKYKFQVCAANSDKKWGNIPAEMTIIIEPPFWATSYAIAFYILIFIMIVIYGVMKLREKAQMKIQRAKELNAIKHREELDKMKFAFFTNVSHELRTPLTLILTPLETLIEESNDSKLKNKLQLIYRNGQRLLSLVNQLLDFRKMEMGGENLKLKINDVVPFIEDTVRQFNDLASEKHIELTFESDENRLLMSYDHEKLYKVMSNLLSNAFKFTPIHGQITVLVKKINEEGKDYAMIKVSDTGCGMSEKDLPHIFDRFYQAEKNDDKDVLGSGIGLYLVKEYVKMHHGEIEVESTIGKGTRFTIKLPTELKSIAQENVDEITFQESESSKEENENSAISVSKKKILIVEDNDEFRMFMAEQLGQRFQVITAKNGMEGEKMVLDEFPDLIVSDLMMPVVDGLEFCHRLKNNIQTSHIPFILLTAKTSDQTRIDGYEAGVDSYISKPFNMYVLQARIDQLIAFQEKRQNQFKNSLEISFEQITTTSLDEKLMQRALESVKNNIDNPEYSIGDLSMDVGLSRTQLNRKLQSIVNMTPLQFIRSIRLKRAGQLLQTTKLSVSEIADLTGFNTIKYFNQHFKEEFGMTPTLFREKGEMK